MKTLQGLPYLDSLIEKNIYRSLLDNVPKDGLSKRELCYAPKHEMPCECT